MFLQKIKIMTFPLNSLTKGVKLTKNGFLKKTPLKNRTKGIIQTGGRNHKGKIVSFHRGGGRKRLYRQLQLENFPTNCVVESLEVDPSRTGLLAKLFSVCLKRHFYVLAPAWLYKGQKYNFYADKNLQLGSKSCLLNIPIGSKVNSISANFRPWRSVFQRAAGTFALLIKKSYNKSIVRFSSGKIAELNKSTFGFLGNVSNQNLRFRNVGNAGKQRQFGVRPQTRGVAMNPVDHPHGGGEGKSSGGRPSVTPWSKPAHRRKTKKK